MMKVNCLKHLESCVKSFEITVERTTAKIEDLEKKIGTGDSRNRSNANVNDIKSVNAMPAV
jgi:hypothetical protein